jgi:hypothetical protein
LRQFPVFNTKIDTPTGTLDVTPSIDQIMSSIDQIMSSFEDSSDIYDDTTLLREEGILGSPFAEEDAQAFADEREVWYSRRRDFEVPEEDEDYENDGIEIGLTEEEKQERIRENLAQGRDATGILRTHSPVCACNFCQPERDSDPVDEYIQSEEYKTALRVFGEETAAQLCFAAIGGSWYDMFYRVDSDPEWDAVMARYYANKQAREAEEARKLAAYRQRQIEEKVAEEARRNLKKGQQVEKNGRLCTRLFSCVGDKHSGGAKPTTMHVSSECWSHERRCPETGALLTPHKCPFLHPGEPGFHKEWLTNRLWMPAGIAETPRVPQTQASRFPSNGRPPTRPQRR